MMTFKKIFRIFTLTLITILFISCGAKHFLIGSMVYKDNQFIYDRLMEEGLIIGGVSSERIHLPYNERAKISSDLSDIFLDKVKNISMMRTAQLVDAIGNEKYYELMSRFDTTRTFIEENCSFIQDSVPGNPYILIAYIENEEIIDRSFEEYVEDIDGEDYIQTDYEKTYLLSMEFHIVALNRNRLVWRQKIRNEAEQTETRTTRTGCKEGCIDAIFNAIFLGEPAKIERKEVMKKIVIKLIKDLKETKMK